MGFIAPLIGLVSAIAPMLNKKQSAPSAPALAPLPAAPTSADASAKAQAEVDKKRRISLLSGGDTNLTNGTAAVSSTDVGKNKLLGQ